MRASAPSGDSGHVTPSHYRAFISYSHADTEWATWLMRRLEGYRVAKRFHGGTAPIGEVGPRLAPVFRDRDELPTTSDLGETIRHALRDSATLIVICSPNSAKSRWVQEEILSFKRLHGERRVFAFIVGGEPKAEGTAEDCFSPALRREVGLDGELSSMHAEVVAADARPHGDGKNAAFIRLVAGLLGVGFDELRQRELQRRNRRLTLIAAASVVGMVVTLGLAVAAWRAKGEALLARNDAQRRQEQAEELLTFMLGDYRDKREKLGQIELLDPVDQKAMDYFATLDPRDLTDTALARQAKALYQIGATRLGETRYNDAAEAFAKSYERAAALTARHPKDADMLIERSTAEEWICQISLHRGDYFAARKWAESVRSSAVALVALEGKTPRVQSKLNDSNLAAAVCDYRVGNFEAARSFFLSDRAAVEESLAAKPGDLGLEHRIGQLDSWLGLVAEFDGNFTAALEYFADMPPRYEKLARLEPAVVNWRLRLAQGLARAGNVQSLLGRWAVAAASYERAEVLFTRLVADNPRNRAWLFELQDVRLQQAALLLAQANIAGAAPRFADARGQIESLVATEPTNHNFRNSLATVWRLEAQMRLLARRTDAGEAVARALALSEALMSESRSDAWVLAEVALANVLAGRIAVAQEKPEVARDHWNRALDALSPRFATTNDWRLLDPAAQVLVLLGRPGEARPLVERLRRFGYQPSDPLAASMLDSAFPTVSASLTK